MMWIGFVIWSIVAIIFLEIGIHSRKEKEAAGFFTFTPPPRVNDVKQYNHAVSNLWLAASGILELIGIPMLFYEQNSPIFVFIILAVVALVLIMMIVYFKIEKKYKK